MEFFRTFSVNRVMCEKNGPTGPFRESNVTGGRCWDRTSDPCRVKAVLSR